ncbi:uncharacterized protein LOC142890681 [Nelusetta ayraudi]|uniref:uncharacterized protein LOC142890681 n=1 Tax=Nelusetta ayraudi TaxID=303726 RepID=UPI003F7225B8
MHLLTLILGIVLLPKVTSLKCYECMDENDCTGTEMTCPPEKSQCGAITLFSHDGGVNASEFIIKSCASPDDCIQGSVNFGDFRTVTVSQCCDTDLCNYQPAPEPKDMAANGLKCYYCDGLSCNATLNCLGDEDRCIDAALIVEDEKIPLKGCASRLLCSRASVPHVKMAMGDDFSCCEGDFCNSNVVSSEVLHLFILQGSQARKTVSRLHKMHLITLILGIVLLPKVTSLKCYQCMGENTCTETTCPSGHKCGAMSMLSYAGGSKMSELQLKSCTSPAECIQGSVNFGITSIQITSQCCDSDLCNKNAAPAPKNTAPNGLSCYTCNGQTCDATLACKGDEDRCISTEVPMEGTKMSLKGCASRLLCSQAANPQLKMAMGESFSCCEGSQCNGGKKTRRAESGGPRSSTSAGLLLLLPTLLLSLLMSS